MRPDADDNAIELLTRVMEGENENKKKAVLLLADMPDELLDSLIDYLESRLK